MLRDAALLQLDLELEALEQGLSLKDATPYNVQFRGSEPVFIDVGSFEALREGEPWSGYRQFCMLYLYPLLLQAYKEIPFQPWLRGSIDGIAPRDAARMFSLRDRLRKGVFTHVALHARLERRYEEREGGEVKEDLKKANFKTSYVKANVQRMRKLVAGLSWKAGDTAWTGYREQNTYTDEDAERKQAFVREAAADAKPGLVWDMGCNDGAYSRIAAESASYVVAFDYDHATVEALYRSLRSEEDSKILPLVAQPRRPLARARLAGARAAPAGAARQAGPDPRAGPDPSRLDHGQRADRRVPRLGQEPRCVDGDRVPEARRPDGQAAALRQEDRVRTRTTSSRPSSASWRSASRSRRPRRCPRAPASSTGCTPESRTPASSREQPGRDLPRTAAARAADRRRPPGRALGVRLRLAAARPAGQEPGLLRRPQQHRRRHHHLRPLLHAAAPAGHAGPGDRWRRCSAEPPTWCST